MPSDDPDPGSTGGCISLDTPHRGRGTFAARRFGRGEEVLAFGGRRVPASRIGDYTHCLEVAPGWFLGPSGGPDDYVNHSCEPNCGVYDAEGGLVLRALRRIVPGEEVTFDYSTVMVTDPTTFVCDCGSRRCRGLLVPFRDLPAAVQRRQQRLGIVPEFVAASAVPAAPTHERPLTARRLPGRGVRQRKVSLQRGV